VRFKKIQSVAKISQSAAEERADDALADEFHCRRRRKMFSSCVRAPFSEVFIFALAVVFALATGESALTRPKQQRAEHRAPPTVERCLLPVTPDASGTPIMMQACQNGRGGLRIIRRNAERPRTITHGSIHAREYHLSAAGPLAERAIAAAPNPPCLLQAAADQPRPRPCRQLPYSFPPGGETTAPIATSWCTPCVNK
jgi:hypothetical protein